MGRICFKPIDENPRSFTTTHGKFRRVAQGRRQVAAHGLGWQGAQRTAQLGPEQFLEVFGVDGTRRSFSKGSYNNINFQYFDNMLVSFTIYPITEHLYYRVSVEGILLYGK